jgi:uncharacterized caspase-like protein
MATSNKNPTPRRKLALIIGNNNYSRPSNRLNQSINNANDLNDLLKSINFNVTMYTDGNAEMMLKITNFAKTIKDGDLVLFYFSGHGYQVKDKNYLIPVDDAEIESDKDVEDIAINVERTFERLVERNPSYVTIFILDCCRPYLLKNARAPNCK